MGWNIEEQGKNLKVEVDGRLVAAVAPVLREEVLGKMGEGTNVLFDLSNMVHIDSSGLGVLVQILQKANGGAAARAEDRLRHNEGEQGLRDRPDRRGREVRVRAQRECIV